jgi:HK97 family phage portal protein
MDAKTKGLRGWLNSAFSAVVGFFDSSKILKSWGLGHANGALSDSGILLNHDAALTISALYRARDVLAGAFLQTEFRLEKMGKDGLTPLDGHPLDNALRFGFDEDLDRSNFLDALVGHACFKKGGFASLAFDKATGEFINATLMNPDWVTVKNHPDGSPGYEYAEPGKEKEWLDEYEVFHLKGPSSDGRQGMNWIDIGKRSLALAIETERYATKFFQKGYHLSGVLNLPGNIQKDAETTLKNELRLANEGIGNAFGLLYLKGEQKFTQTNMISANDAQLLGMRGFNVFEVSRWTGVPPSKLYADKGTTYNGAEQEWLDFLTNCLSGWVRRFKDQFTKKLIPRNKRGKWVITHSFQEIQSADALTATRTEALRINWAMSTPNRSIRRLGLGTDLPGGDVPMRPLNMAAPGTASNAAPGGGGSPVVTEPMDGIDPTETPAESKKEGETNS